MTADKQRQALKGQLKVTRLLSSHEIDLRTWEILLLIALDEGEGAVALAKKHKIAKSVFSRHVLFLSGQRAQKGNSKDAPDASPSQVLNRCLVEKRNDPKDIRRHNLFITSDGWELIGQVNDAFAA
jgi:DNA-binding MarR family transcriptional regulator